MALKSSKQYVKNIRLNINVRSAKLVRLSMASKYKAGFYEVVPDVLVDTYHTPLHHLSILPKATFGGLTS